MTTLLGTEPRYLGWLDLGKGGYGFLFKGDKGNVLAAWSPSPGKQLQGQVRRQGDGDGPGRQAIGARRPARNWSCPCMPIFIGDVPSGPGQTGPGQRRQAVSVGRRLCQGQSRHLPAGSDECRGRPQANHPKTTVVVNDLTESYRRPDFANPALKSEGRYIYFRVDPQFVPFGTRELEITIVAKRLASEENGRRSDLMLRIGDRLHGRAGLVDDSQGRQVARTNLDDRTTRISSASGGGISASTRTVRPTNS